MNAEDIVAEEMDDFEDWSNRNKMKSNSMKCKIMRFGTMTKDFYCKLFVGWK